MTYRVEKYNWCDGIKIADYGSGWTEDDVKRITKGYKRSKDASGEYAATYERKNCKYCFFVAKDTSFFKPENIGIKAYWE